MLIARKNHLPLCTYPLTARIVGAPQMTSQPVSFFFSSLSLCSLLPSVTWRSPGLSIPTPALAVSRYSGPAREGIRRSRPPRVFQSWVKWLVSTWHHWAEVFPVWPDGGRRVPQRTQRSRVRPGEEWAPPGCTLPLIRHEMTTNYWQNRRSKRIVCETKVKLWFSNEESERPLWIFFLGGGKLRW